MGDPNGNGDYLQDLQQRLQSAVANIRKTGTDDQNKMLDYLLNQAQSQTADLVNGDSNSSPIHHILANVKSLLMHAQVVPTSTGEMAVSSISDEGDIVGKNPYESLDVRWTESAVCWLEHFSPDTKAPFRTDPPTISLPAKASIALAGDWGTGYDYRTDGMLTPAEKVAKQINALTPTYTVHLGDVYYAGTDIEEQNNFIGKWPAGAGATGSFTLNSNHEMYSGAEGYYSVLDTAAQFAMQKKNSYFALVNDDWLVIGLDTAYHADEIHLYQHGFLDDVQCKFLDDLLATYTKPKRAILLSHHNGLSVDGMTPSALWGQIAPRFAGLELWWYWGHMHAGIVYSDRDTRGQTQSSVSKAGIIHARCAGHGAVPAAEPDSLVANPGAVWHENRTVADLLYPGRVYNGLVSLTLSGADLTEEFIDEDGSKVYARSFF